MMMKMKIVIVILLAATSFDSATADTTTSGTTTTGTTGTTTTGTTGTTTTGTTGTTTTGTTGTGTTGTGTTGTGTTGTGTTGTGTTTGSPTTPTTTTTTTPTTVTTPTTILPCNDADGAGACQVKIQNNDGYCNGPSTKYLARATCCWSCANNLGFTKQVASYQQQNNGAMKWVWVIAVDFSSAAAAEWNSIPKVNVPYPGMSAADSEKRCKDRSKSMGLANFCRSPTARMTCGKTCASYNTPAP